MYAIILTGGKQYRVAEGERVLIEKLDKKVGEEVRLDNVLMLGDGDNVKVGTPVVKDAGVVAEITAQKRGPKMIIFKKQAKKGYKKTRGHRQDLTELKIKKIEYSGEMK